MCVRVRARVCVGGSHHFHHIKCVYSKENGENRQYGQKYVDGPVVVCRAKLG